MRTVTWIAAVLALLLAVPAHAGDEPDLKAVADRFAAPLVEAEAVVGMAIGIVRGEERVTIGYGRLAPGSDKAPDGDTVYEIGSITKVFTGYLLADMVRDKTVRLDQPVRELLPEGTKLPTFKEQEITLVSLATHTSGMLRMPLNFAPKDPKNPYADYDRKRMFAFLANWDLPRAPGEKCLYSNLGVALLGQALAMKAGTTYEALLTERILRPFGMKSTAIAFTDDMKKRLAPGHNGDGDPQANWDLNSMAPAGAIRSTANDMLTFLVKHFEPGPTVTTALTVHFDGGEKGTKVGLGWHAGKIPGSWWHNGQTGGYHSMAIVIPAKRLAIVVLTNTAVGLVDDMASRISVRLSGGEIEPQKVRRAVKVEPEILESYVGRYTIVPGMTVAVTRNDRGLSIQLTGQPRVRIYAESETAFFLRVVAARVEFEKDEAGKVARLVIHQNGRKTVATRLPDPPEAPEKK